MQIHLNVGRSPGFSDQHSDIMENLENRIIRIKYFYYVPGDLPSYPKKMWKGLSINPIQTGELISFKNTSIYTDFKKNGMHSGNLNGGSKMADFPF